MPRLTCLKPRVAVLDTRSAKPPEKTADAELLTAEHRAWRRLVIARAGGRCERVDAGARCNRAEPRMFADHVIERKDGGAKLDPANGQCLCGKHHSIKTARSRIERMR
jgi:5-methylcytosine-specific restriction enzyme A